MRRVGSREVVPADRDTVSDASRAPRVPSGSQRVRPRPLSRRFSETRATRWSARSGRVPAGAEALLLLTLEEIAVNELRETFHHWVRTLCVPIRRASWEPAAACACTGASAPTSTLLRRRVELAREIWEEIGRDLRRAATPRAARSATACGPRSTATARKPTKTERERFQQRQGEVSALITQSTIQRLEREIVELREQSRRYVLFDRDSRLKELERSHGGTGGGGAPPATALRGAAGPAPGASANAY